MFANDAVLQSAWLQHVCPADKALQHWLTLSAIPVSMQSQQRQERHPLLSRVFFFSVLWHWQLTAKTISLVKDVFILPFLSSTDVAYVIGWGGTKGSPRSSWDHSELCLSQSLKYCHAHLNLRTAVIVDRMTSNHFSNKMESLNYIHSMFILEL